MKSIVWAKLPRAGLGNKLLVWADAYIYAHKHQLPLITTGWVSIHIGPYLRSEKNKRFYYNEVIRITCIKLVVFKFKTVFLKHDSPTIDGSAINNNHLYIVSNYPHYSVWFNSVTENIDLIRKGLEDLLHPKVKISLANSETPVIAIHVRMGDFKKVASETDYMNEWVARTPLVYFKKVISALRQKLGFEAPVTLFSDGHDYELSELLSIPNVKRHQSQRDIVDIILMSKAKILITSQGSSFSYWATALSHGLVIHHLKDATVIRSNNFNATSFEGKLFANELGELSLPKKLCELLLQMPHTFS